MTEAARRQIAGEISALGGALLLVAVGACTYEATPGPLSTAPRTLELIALQPPAGARNVALDSPIDLFFNVPIAGESVGGVDVRLFSGRIEAQGHTAVDLFAARIRFTAFEPLRPDLLHRVYVSDSIRGLDGSRLEAPVVVELTTGRTSGSAVPDPPTEVRADELQPIWNARCQSCHAGQAPRAGLDLGTPAAARASLVRVRSEQTSLPRVAPGAHAESYLLRKLLRRYAFAGLPMPPDDGGALTAQELRLVAQWIDTGAR